MADLSILFFDERYNDTINTFLKIGQHPFLGHYLLNISLDLLVSVRIAQLSPECVGPLEGLNHAVKHERSAVRRIDFVVVQDVQDKSLQTFVNGRFLLARTFWKLDNAMRQIDDACPHAREHFHF